MVEHSSTSAVISIEFLMEEIELLVAQNPKFEYGAKTKFLAVCGIFGLSQVRCMDENRKFVNGIALHKRKWSMEALVGGIITVITETYEFD